jgi:hypothetical protein
MRVGQRQIGIGVIVHTPVSWFGQPELVGVRQRKGVILLAAGCRYRQMLSGPELSRVGELQIFGFRR